MERNFFTVLTLSCAVLLSNMCISQNKAQIQIRRNNNGVESEETREIILEEGQDVESILREMGVLDEFGQLKSGQDIEIKIDKFNTDGMDENIMFYLSPEQGIGGLPEFAPAPPMQNKTYLGVMLRQDVNFNPNEVLVTEVVAGSPAEACGIQVGDKIVKLDKTEIHDAQAVIDYVQSKKKGDKINITVKRDDKEKKLKVTLGEKSMPQSGYFRIPQIPEIPRIPEIPTIPQIPNYNFRFGPDSITIYCPPAPGCILPDDSMKICQPFSWNGEGLAVQETAFLGVTPAEIETEKGVRVNVEEGTSAEKMGITDGDVIISVNAKPVNNFNELADEISKLKPGEIVNISIVRDGKEKELSGEVGKRSVSGFDDFRIFHDFKGMDEGGNFLYDYEFDMDEKDVEERMEELLQELDREQDRIDQERDRIENELDRMNRDRESMTIRIQISELTAEDIQKLNRSGNKFEMSNTLMPDQISFYPNPGEGILNLSFSLSSIAPVKITLSNASGEMIYLEERAMFDGQYKNIIDISNEPNGIYFLQIVQGNQSYSKKIIKGL
jgi:membrane-associated protease RseP (regulator of RpoE activity)